ncbi:MAG: PSD1 and planctomycete cytochrome C domain-containing protein [bacterium]|nr:PSD1 and planctomycete cytochrome C domain-containing protein [bacterium]
MRYQAVFLRRKLRKPLWISFFVCFVVCATSLAQEESAELAIPETLDFARDIQPIFSAACTSCHGGVKQAADLSFVNPKSVLPPQGWVIEPGRPDESELFHRIVSDDPELRMPPPEEHPQGLSARDIGLIRRWIEQGAIWTDHWSRAALQAPAVEDSTASTDWAKQTVDHIVAAEHQRQGLAHAREANPEEWLRRVSLDLIGLPPTADEHLDFLRQVREAEDETARDAIYEKQVDRLLASAHFGERWASMWMDLARYADSKGFEKDPHRDIWPYRDWLIRAFNADMPYDEFTVRQLAGDLLPDATFEDLIATAFHRNTQTNTEGGTDDEEFRTAAVIDRLNTTWTVWQATTFGCVQCHAHPYEPFANHEYYAGLALFNSTEDCDLDSEFPTIPYTADPAKQQEWLQLTEKERQITRAIDAIGHQRVQKTVWNPLPVLSASSTSGMLNLVGSEVRSSGTVAVGSTYTLTARAESLSALRIHILPVSDAPEDWPEQGSVLSHIQLSKHGPESEQPQPINLTTVIPDFRAGSYEPEQVLQPNKDGFGGYPKLFGPRWVVICLETPLKLDSDESLQIELIQKSSVTGGLSNHIRRLRIDYSADQKLSALANNSEVRELRDELDATREKLSEFRGPEVPIMQERSQSSSRTTREFLRGNFLEKGAIVRPGIPQAFQAVQDSRIENRLDFARWLVSDANPLSARVWANRLWSELFGIGLVETLEDFGPSGTPPVHPELLEYLANFLREDCGWRIKPFLRSMVLSATYRQDSKASPQAMERDPKNRFLARGPRTRLTAEMIRDQALLASGKLNRSIGGPSVMPPQPEGVWQQAYSSAQWQTAIDQDRYRRGLYTYWRRTSPYPGFLMFDAPVRDVCSARRIPTNTPLQALVTLNSEVYAELAKALAQRCYSETESLPDAVDGMFLSVTSRPASDQDKQVLMELLQSLMPGDNASVSVESDHENADSGDVQATQHVLDKLSQVALAILNSDWALTK